MIETDLSDEVQYTATQSSENLSLFV